jgi:ABC-type nickel/cobalt efflux system permease component RcnA
MNKAAIILIFSSLSTAIFHTLIPDHWLPFVLIGRVRGWSIKKTALISGFSALLHVSLSLVLGLFAILIGLGTALAIGETLEKVGGILLILFGLFYAFWSYRKGGHFHIGGRRIHKHEIHKKDHHHNPNEMSETDWHLDEGIVREGLDKGDLYLALIIGLNPCVLIFPIMFSSVPHGLLVTSSVALIYFLATSFTMVGLTILGLKWTKKIKIRFLSKYGEILSGLLIFLIGIVFLFFNL